VIDETHCYKLGSFMAHSHHALNEFKEHRKNPYHLNWMNETLAEHKEGLADEDRSLLTELIENYTELLEQDLPRGLIHGDLFRDNALFADDQLSGVIDFYHTCEDMLIQDIAIAINDWCLTEDGSIEPALKRAMIAGYESMRELTAGEKTALLPMQRASTARFALTRLLSGDPPLKDPAEMYALANQLSDDR
jgi:homoserine kinase type II